MKQATTRQIGMGLVVAVMGTIVLAGEAGGFWLLRQLKEIKQCRVDLQTCEADLAQCDAELAECELDTQTFPGDGYSDPSFGTNGHGPALSYTPDLGDLTTTDENTGFMWEVKLPDDDVDGNCTDGDQANRSVHCVNNEYDWSSTGSANDGTLFTEFLRILNETCDGDESTSCTMDSQCTGIGNELCGHAGYTDWEIPNIKKLQSIIDYGVPFPGPTIDPSFPGATAASHWSATTYAFTSDGAWFVFLGDGIVSVAGKSDGVHARAVRAGSD